MNLIKQILLETEGKSVLDKKIKNPETGRNVKVKTALSYDNSEPVKQKAMSLVKGVQGQEKRSKEKNPKSHKPKSNSYGISKECVEVLKKKGFEKLNVLPQSFVKPEQIKFNPELKSKGSDKTWVAKFPAKAPNGKDIIKTAYTAEFMKNSAKKKYAKISKIKDKDIQKLEENTKKLLTHKDPKVSDSACVIGIIAKTGLRVGSLNDSETGNLGVRTLKAENISVQGNKVSLNFIGKSYQENNASFEDPNIASYLKKKLSGKKDKDNVFDCSYNTVGEIMKKINPKGINPKDLRTYTATKTAREQCNKIAKELDPLPTDPKQLKKTIKDKLNEVFEYVAIVLNNTPNMAKNSYIHPAVITEFLDNLGVTPKLVGYKHATLESILREIDEKANNSMDEFLEEYKEYGEDVDGISDDDLDMCDEYELPDWWDNEDIQLVLKKSNQTANPLNESESPIKQILKETVAKQSKEFDNLTQLNKFEKSNKKLKINNIDYDKKTKKYFVNFVSKENLKEDCLYGTIQGYNITLDDGSEINLKHGGFRNAFPLQCKIEKTTKGLVVTAYNSKGNIAGRLLEPYE